MIANRSSFLVASVSYGKLRISAFFPDGDDVKIRQFCRSCLVDACLLYLPVICEKDPAFSFSVYPYWLFFHFIDLHVLRELPRVSGSPISCG